VDALPKPWYNLEDYRAVRLREASYEAEIAEKFLEEGLIRNAAGKAFQAWKAVVAAYAVDKVDDLRKVFPGVKRLRGSGRRVEAVMWILAIMPTSKLKAIASIIGGDIDVYTNIALDLHDYQYNGPDPEGVFSPYPSDDVAAHDVRRLVEKVKELVNKLGYVK
jgi:hypothetical protein